TVWIVFNGEIYNYVELREALVARGHRFKTNSDTEVVVHLYEDLGRSCVHPLRGMFAFALWDEKSRTLLLARDRLGKKPLYYSFLSGRALVFGSELKAVVEDPAVERAIEVAAWIRARSSPRWPGCSSVPSSPPRSASRRTATASCPMRPWWRATSAASITSASCGRRRRS